MSSEPGQPLAATDSSTESVLAELDPRTDPRWDEFVTSHPEGTVYHHSAWTQVLAETYGHTPLYLGLVSEDGRRLTGALPFLFISSVITGRRLVALPYTTYCTPLMPGRRLEEVLRYALTRFRGAKYVEVKLLKRSDETGGPDHREAESPFVSQVLSLNHDIEALFRSFHESSVRQRVRRAEKAGLTFRIAESESDLRRFYELFEKLRQGQGLPCCPYRFFANMRRLMAPLNLFEMPVVEFEGRVVAAAVVLKGRFTWHLEYTASDEECLRLGSNQLLIWECIKRAHRMEARTFDFGRTSLGHKSLLEFKDRWHTERHPISHRYYPDDTEHPNWRDPFGSAFVRLNKKMPLLLLKWEGRLIYPHRS